MQQAFNKSMELPWFLKKDIGLYSIPRLNVIDAGGTADKNYFMNISKNIPRLAYIFENKYINYIGVHF